MMRRRMNRGQLDCDLTDRKKEVDELVMEVIDEQTQDDEEEDEQGEESESEEEKKPKKKAAAKPKPKAKSKRADSESGSEFSPGDSDEEEEKAPSDGGGSDYEKPKAKKKKAGGGGGKNGYTAPVKLSEDLADIVGGDEMPRHEVVKRMWAYIKENKLQDPKNKQFIKCDEKLSKVIPTKKFRGFGMVKYLKDHMNVE